MNADERCACCEKDIAALREKLHEHEKVIFRLDLSVSLLGNMFDEVSEAMGNLYALIEKLHPPEGPILPQDAKPIAPIIPFAARIASAMPSGDEPEPDPSPWLPEHDPNGPEPPHTPDGPPPSEPTG